MKTITLKQPNSIQIDGKEMKQIHFKTKIGLDLVKGRDHVLV